MKKILICISVLFLTLSCTSSKFYNPLPYNDLQYDVSRYTMDFYYIHLKYPNVEELSQYCWNIANSAYDNRFSSYAEYKSVVKHPTYEPGIEVFLHFLMNNPKKLSFRLKKGNTLFFWKSKGLVLFDFDYCDLYKAPERAWRFFCLFDSTGTYKISTYDEEIDFSHLRKSVKEKWLSDHKLSLEAFKVPALLRYNRKQGYTQFCPTDSMITENLYLKDLGMALDTFLVNRNAETIQFVTLVPSFTTVH